MKWPCSRWGHQPSLIARMTAHSNVREQPRVVAACLRTSNSSRWKFSTSNPLTATSSRVGQCWARLIVVVSLGQFLFLYIGDRQAMVSHCEGPSNEFPRPGPNCKTNGLQRKERQMEPGLLVRSTWARCIIVSAAAFFSSFVFVRGLGGSLRLMWNE